MRIQSKNTHFILKKQILQNLISHKMQILEGLKNMSILGRVGLNTILSAVVGIVNSKPLTPVNDNSADFEALNPNHLLWADQI